MARCDALARTHLRQQRHAFASYHVVCDTFTGRGTVQRKLLRRFCQLLETLERSPVLVATPPNGRMCCRQHAQQGRVHMSQPVPEGRPHSKRATKRGCSCTRPKIFGAAAAAAAGEGRWYQGEVDHLQERFVGPDEHRRHDAALL